MVEWRNEFTKSLRTDEWISDFWNAFSYQTNFAYSKMWSRPYFSMALITFWKFDVPLIKYNSTFLLNDSLEVRIQIEQIVEK